MWHSFTKENQLFMFIKVPWRGINHNNGITMQYPFQDAFQIVFLFDKENEQEIMEIGTLYVFRIIKASSFCFNILIIAIQYLMHVIV